MRSSAALQVPNEIAPAPGIVSFSLDINTKNLISVSSGLEELLGASSLNLARDASLFLRHCAASDRFRLLGELDRALSRHSSLIVSYEWARPDSNQTIKLHCRAACINHNQQIILRGIIFRLDQDFSVYEPDAVQHLIDALPNFVCLLDSDLAVARLPNWFNSRRKDYPSAPIKFCDIQLGQTLWELLANKKLHEEWSETIERLLRNPPSRYREQLFLNGRHYQIEISSFANALGFILSLADLSDQVEREDMSKKLALQEQRQHLSRLAMHQVSNSLLSVSSVLETFKKHCAIDSAAQETINQVQHSTLRAANFSQRVCANFFKHSELSAVNDLSLLLLDAVDASLDCRIVLENAPELLVLCNASATVGALQNLIKQMLDITPLESKIIISACSNLTPKSQKATPSQFAILKLRVYPHKVRRRRLATEPKQQWALNVEQIVSDLNAHGLKPVIKFEPSPAPCLSVFFPLYQGSSEVDY